MKQSFISLSNTIIRELDFTNELNLFHQVKQKICGNNITNFLKHLKNYEFVYKKNGEKYVIY